MAAVEVVVGTPLADALQNAVQPKLVEVGWSTGGLDDSALSEYIILMLVNGKTQDQIASELSNDLLGLGPDDPNAIDFARWLFEQVNVLNTQLNGGSSSSTATSQPIDANGAASGAQQIPSGPRTSGVPAHDAEMGDATDGANGAIPTGPKAMRNGVPKQPRDKRMLGQLNKALDRSGDAALHRVRNTAGTGRINTHANKEVPKGPRNQQLARNLAAANGRPMGPPGPMGMPQMPMQNSNMASPMMPSLTPDQMYGIMAMLAQQAGNMAASYEGQNATQNMGGPIFNPAFQNGWQAQGQQQGKSLFERVDKRQQRANGRFQNQQKPQADVEMAGDTEHASTDGAPTSSMEVENSQQADRDPFDTICKFNLNCTKPDCPFAHQSPAAPPGMTVDMSDTCSFGAACKNAKCAARHPSPAKKIQHAAETECRFGPNCAKYPNCPFKHSTMPFCRNGADCSVPNCKFTHNNIPCRFNPCTNRYCPYKHAEGQKRGTFGDKVWTADGEKKEHVSERKFVEEDGGEEELILPGSGAQEQPAAGSDDTQHDETRIIT